MYSLAVRYRFAHKSDDWYVECITCKTTYPLKKMQNGHFMSRGYNSTRYCDQNTAPQCLTASSWVQLESGEYRSIAEVKVGDRVRAFDEEIYTDEIAEVLSAKSFIPKKLYEVELEDGRKFKCTTDHKMLCEVRGKLVWCDAERVNTLLRCHIPCNIISI